MLKNLEEKVYIKVYMKGDDQPADYDFFAKKLRISFRSLEDIPTIFILNLLTL